MTKEEILRKVVPDNCYWEENFDNVPRHYIETAMDQYAKQHCISFAEYLAINEYHYYRDDNEWGVAMQFPYKRYTTEELYTLFLNHQ